MKKRIFSALLALVMCLGLLPVTASAAEEKSLPDWYFLFAIFKNVDADGKDKNGKAVHVKYSMSQDEVDVIRDFAQAFETYMNQVGVMRAHVDVVEIDETLRELQESTLGSFCGSKQATPLLKSKVDLDKYDHVTCFVTFEMSLGYGGVTGNEFENGTGHSCINFYNREQILNLWADYSWKPGYPVHEYLHFMERLNKKWGEEFGLHDVMNNFYERVDGEFEACYTDLILNQAKGTAGTGVHPAVWQYPPHVMRTMTELNVPSSVISVGDGAFRSYAGLTDITFSSGNASIGDRTFWGLKALSRVTIPTSMTSIGYAAFWDTGIKDVYYAGTAAQWKAIKMGDFNEALTRANIHYNHLMADVKTTDWFAKYVQWAMGKGIAAGTGEGKFSPGKNCTVAEVMAFLYKAYGAPEVGKNPYSNLKTGDWYAKPAIWAHEKGLISGSSFTASTPCTRAMVVEYLWKLTGSPAAQAATFGDVPTTASYAQAVNWAVASGVTAGVKDNQFGPDVVCTRGQIVTFLYAALAK
ncbi:MAG: leucine-rich repeat protein [Lawsonibacter sp.]|nr:leucine-rich repeat protein [Lawsonibacter sp.]